MTTADSLFDLARAAIPDPRKPRPGDTYQRGRSVFGTGDVIVVAEVHPWATIVYVDGEAKSVGRFDLWLRSMPDVCAVCDVPARVA